MWSGINYQEEINYQKEKKLVVHNFWCEVFGHKADYKNPKTTKGIFDCEARCVCCKRCGFEMYITEELFSIKIPIDK